MKWLKRLAAVVGAVLLLWVMAWLAVPPVLTWQAQTRLTALLGRTVTVGDVSFQPWRLELAAQDVVVAAAATPAAASASSAGPLLRVARVRANLAFWPLFKGLPVIESLDIESPRVNLARLSAGHYDVDDLIDRFAANAGPATGEPTRFALYNLQVRDAQLRFDDRPARRVHQVEALQLALPFLSNLPAQVQVTVVPRLAFKLNGVAFDTGAQATPFAPTRHADLKLAMSGLDLGPYLVYLPESLPLRVTRGVVSADLALEFMRREGGTPQVVLRGWVGARDLALVDATGAPWLAWRQLRLGLRDVQPLARRLAFDALRIDGAQLHVARDAAGRIDMPWSTGAALPAAPGVPAARAASAPSAARAAAAPSAASTAPAAAAAQAAPGWQISLASIELTDARLLWNDAAVRPAAALQLDALTLTTQALQWPMVKPAELSLSTTLRAQAEKAPPAGRVIVAGAATDRDAQLHLTVSDLALDAVAPYLAQAVVPRIAGTVSAQAKLDWSADAAAPRLQLAVDNATLDKLQVQPGRGPAAQDGATLLKLTLADAQLDVHARSVTLGSATLAQPSVLLSRDAQGRFNIPQWLRSSDGGGHATGTGRAAGSPEPAWRVQVRRLQLDGGRIQLADAFVRRDAGGRPLRAELHHLQLGIQDFGWFGDRAMPPTKLRLSARVAGAATARDKTPQAGTLDWNGQFGLLPLQAGGRLRVVRLPVQVFGAYFADLLPVHLVRAEAGYTGQFSLRQQAAGWTVSAAGDVLLGDVHTTTLPDADNPALLVTGADELLGWQAFALQRVTFVMKPGTRPQLEVGEAALTDLFARLVVTEEGRFNLQDVGTAPPAAAAASAAGAAPAPVPASAATAVDTPAGLPLDIRVGATRLSNGHIDFSDHFVRPNYSADLTELNGELGPFDSTSRAMATLQLRGRAAGTALLDIRGQLNPMAQPLALDIQARATDLELAPLSPYAGKYAGYAIERGKLSLEVAYKIDADGKLQASNQLVLNQLTFGERIESPSATKLPVLLAVALLKDRHGVIDINLPISGSVNDPQFSVGRIILRLILNLIGKALTAPFTLLMGGGGGPDLSYVEFTPGTAVIAESGAGGIAKVAKALAERPALKMTVTGTVDPVAEREAYQRAAIETRLLAERRREGLRAGAAASAPVTLAADDRLRLLKALYRQTDLPDKPRNALGLARDLPAAEMEALLRKHVPVTAELMRELALQRGLAVRDALMASGLPSERLFLAAPKLHEPADGAAAWTPQVQLSLSVK